MPPKRGRVTKEKRVLMENNVSYHKNTNNGHTSNSFAALRKQMEIDEHNSNEAEEQTEKIHKPPPIVIDKSVGFTDVIQFIGKEYNYKRISIGTKVFSTDLIKYTDLIEKLKKTDYQYHTHKVKSRNTFKMILTGLPKVDVSLITSELNSMYGVEALSINEIVTKRTTPHDALYIVEFNRSIVKRQVLHKINFLNNVSIKWQNHNPKRKGPTQCNNCGMYGHGGENCSRKTTCLLCASLSHNTDKCGLNNSLPGKHFKCFNCINNGYEDVNHKANDPICP